MSSATGIEWTDATWNPVRGCTRVSEGCRNCYAETIAGRFAGEGLPYEGLVRINPNGRAAGWNGQVRFVEEHLLDPLRWKRPRRIFVNSMSDLFHPGVADEQLDRIFAVMALCPQHTFQVLTKRPERMLEYLRQVSDERDMHRWVQYADEFAAVMEWTDWPEPEWPLPNVWLGVSVEDQAAADERIPLLLQTPAAVRFLSVEPLLGLIDFGQVCPSPGKCCGECGWPSPYRLLGTSKYEFIDWVIVGGESGKGARPMHPDWARSLRDQCVAAGVAFFFKQWGEWAPTEDAGDGKIKLSIPAGAKRLPRKPECAFGDGDFPSQRIGKKAAGDLLDGVQWHQFPEVVA